MLILLFVLQFKGNVILRIIVTLSVIGLAAAVVWDYQIKLYICNSEQNTIARMFQASDPTDDFSWATNAADRYWSDKDKSHDGKLLDRSYCSYLKEEPKAPGVDYD